MARAIRAATAVGVPLARLLLVMGTAQAAGWQEAYQSGLLARDQGRYQEARQHLEAARAAAGLDALDLRRADLDDALAVVHQMLGDPVKAEPLYLEAEQILEAHPEAPPALRAMVAGDLGSLRFGQGRLPEARSLLERALAIGTESLGSRHALTGTAAARLGQLERMEGRLAEAEDLLARAVAIHAATLPATHADRVLSETALGELYLWQGRHDEASVVLEAVAEAARQQGEGHPRFAASLVSLADLYRLEGRPARAAPLFEKALAVYERSLGPDHPSVADVLLDMSADAIAEGKASRAEAQVTRALDILRKVHGPDHTTVAFGEYRLAQAYTQEGRLAEAEELLRHALPIQERTYGDGHHLVADCVSEVASVQARQRRFTDAAWSYQRAISIYETAGSRAGPGLVLALQHYAALLKADRRAEARASRGAPASCRGAQYPSRESFL